jgi:hypothetical protein
MGESTLSGALLNLFQENTSKATFNHRRFLSDFSHAFPAIFRRIVTQPNPAALLPGGPRSLRHYANGPDAIFASI